MKIIVCKVRILVMMELVGGTIYVGDEYSLVGFGGGFLMSLLVM